MEELETLKDDIYKEIKESNGLHINKIEELQEIMLIMKNEKQDQRLFIASIEQSTFFYFLCNLKTGVSKKK